MLILLLLTGRLVIWGASWSQLAPVKYLYQKWFDGCNFCFGVWVFGVLDIFFKVHTRLDIPYIPIVTESATGVIMSFGVFVFVEGWRVLFGGRDA